MASRLPKSWSFFLSEAEQITLSYPGGSPGVSAQGGALSP